MSRATRVLPMVALCLAVGLPTISAAAQTQARRLVPRGEVTGLEMGIEGSLSATPGGRVRWFVTLYEVLRRRDLRPSPGSRLEVTASYAPVEPVAAVVTDARGRAAIEIPIPDDLSESVEIRVTAVSPRNVRRVFSVGLSSVSRHDVTLFVDRDDPRPGGTVAAFGRVLDRVSGRPAASVTVTLSARASGPLMAPRTLTTDQSGVFYAEVPVGDLERSVTIAVVCEQGAAQRMVTVQTTEAPLMWVEARPETPVAAPGQNVSVLVHVRREDGSPIEGARASFDGVTRRDDDDTPLPRTDREGRLRVPWMVAHLVGGSFEERTRQLTILHPGIGSISVPVHLRVTRKTALAAWSVEGGALVPELSGTVHVRAVAPSGAPLRGQRVTLEAPRLGGTLTGTTDQDGVVSFDGRLAAGRVIDECGGPTATAATLVIGTQRESLCLPVDPDGTVVMRADDVVGDGPIAVRIERRRALSRSPVEVTLLAREERAWVPVARALLPARQDRLSMEAPAGVGGELWLRARPLMSDARAARGGGLTIYRGAAGQGLSLAANDADARISGGAEGTTAIFATLAAHETALERDVNAQLGPVARAVMSGAGAGYLRALMAARTKEDIAASVVLREGQMISQPLPAAPVEAGLLRDPWRTRARFVRGRIGRLMRAVEHYADARIPGQMEEVAVRVGGRFRFNQAVLSAALLEAGLGDETAAALDGEPLDIAALTQMDRAFSFDNVARRITRERLFRLLVMLREHVRSLGLDRPWARRGDPGEYLSTLIDGSGSFESVWPERSHLFDGWGSPFVLRPAVGGRARFSFLEPVQGWELVSAGPDGRAGTADDIVDPFARVLPSSGIYAEAVGEDILLARLGGVALGRATVESLSVVFQVEVAAAYDEQATGRSESWRVLPEPIREAPEDGRRSVITSPIGGVSQASGPRPWEMPRERRAYAAVALRFGVDGSVEMARDELEAGLAWAARLTLPSAMRPGELLRLPLSLVQLAEAPAPTIEVRARGGAVEARYADGELTLRALRPGMARLTVHIRVGETEIESFSERVRVVPEGSLRARHAGTVARSDTELSVTMPDDATPFRAHLVVGAPRALARDPLLIEAAERHPAVAAWAAVVTGQEHDEELLARMTRTHHEERWMGALPVACALTVWAAAEGPEARALLPGATTELTRRVSDELGSRASVLAALAASAPGMGVAGADALSALLTELRHDGWRALATAPDRPAVMARMAAALLLADRRDVPGRALVARVVMALEEDPHGRRWVPGYEGSAGDGWIGTLALAIAARQVGDDALADELAGNVMGRLYMVERLGTQGAFWAVAASAYGVFGIDGPETVEVEVDGRSRTVRLDDGAAVVSVAPGATAVVRSARPVWVRSESRYLVPRRASQDAPLSARLDGTTGAFGERAALELVVSNRDDDTSPAPIVEITIPGAARLDSVAEAAVASAAGVRRVEGPDPAGVMRVHLESLAEGAVVRVPLPLEWIARGQTLGFGMSLYDARTPWHIVSVEGRTLTIEGPRR